MSKILTGRVSSDKTDKTIIISVTTRKTHPLYKKQYTVNTKFMAHDEKNIARLGDLVAIKEHRPISARKRFILDRILETAKAGFEERDAVSDVPVPEQSTNPPEVKMPAKAKEVKTPKRGPDTKAEK